MTIKNIPQSFLDYVRFYCKIDEGYFTNDRQYIKTLKTLWQNESNQRKKYWLNNRKVG